MSIRVLIVDDSILFQKYLKSIIDVDPELEIAGIAANGQEAIELRDSTSPDVITMDVNMPVMDGITTVRKIMSTNPIPILMLSSATLEGAQATFDALEAGALDFVPKSRNIVLKQFEINPNNVIYKIKTLAKCKVKKLVLAEEEPSNVKLKRKPYITAINKTTGKYDIVIIGSSTGGPVAVQTIIQALPSNFPLPVVIVQHMPEGFTSHFAVRINELSGFAVKEAQNGETILPGQAYIAQGGMQLIFMQQDNAIKIKVKDDPNQLYRPSVDVVFNSAKEVFKSRVLALVLTGMGSDGKKGAQELKNAGSTVWAQNEQSSVVFGMPCSVIKAGLVDKVLDLKDISSSLIKEIM